MSNVTSGPAARHGQTISSVNSAVASALSFYPNFDHIPESELQAVRSDLVLLISRLQRVNNLSPAFQDIAFSPHMTALIERAGLG